MKLRIALLADKETEKIVRKYSEDTASALPVLFTLDDQHLPHVTLIHIEAYENQLENIEKNLRVAVQDESVIQVDTDSIRLDKEDLTYIGLYFKEDTTIFTLRDKVYRAVQGNIQSSSTFREPHMTLTRLKDERQSKDALDLLKDFPHQQITLIAMILCDSQDNGTVSKILSPFPLT